MNIITIIPARGGSKSIPLKNIQLLNNKPLISYSIEYSQKCPLVSHTVVSTDSKRIAKIAKDFNAEIPFLRPCEISQDKTKDFPVINHALKLLEDIYGKQIDVIIWLRPTSPLRPEGLIEKAIAILESNPSCTSIRSVVKSKEHPYRQWFLTDNFIKSVVGEASYNEPYNIPRQDLPDSYFQSGDIEVIKRNTILSGSISGDKIIPLIIKQNEMLDIDHFSDLTKAEKKISE
jgi:CMP-N,N'-diacetyllegionaminic acid synthase